MKTHVIYSNEAFAPFQKIKQDYFYHRLIPLQEIEDAENEENFRYAHYYKEVLNDYDIMEYHYIESVNCPT